MNDEILIKFPFLPEGKGWTPDFGGMHYEVKDGVVTFEDGDVWDQRKQGAMIIRTLPVLPSCSAERGGC